jgi:YVTN family beta-propeller protein
MAGRPMYPRTLPEGQAAVPDKQQRERALPDRPLRRYLAIPVAAAALGLTLAPAASASASAGVHQDSKSLTPIATIPIGDVPCGVAVDQKTDTIYAPSVGGVDVYVIDGATNTVQATIGVGARPTSVAVDPVTDTIYVASYVAGDISVIDGATNTVTATIPVAGMLAVDQANDIIYVNTGTTVVVINGRKDEIVHTIKLTSDGSLTQYLGIAVDAATNTIYAAEGTDGSSGSVAVISGTTRKVVRTILGGKYERPLQVAVNPVTDMVYTTAVRSGKILVINGATDTLTATFHVRGHLTGLAVDTADNGVFVGGFGGVTVTEVNGTTGHAVASAEAPAEWIAVDSATKTIYSDQYRPDEVAVTGI